MKVDLQTWLIANKISKEILAECLHGWQHGISKDAPLKQLPLEPEPSQQASINPA